MKVYVFALGLAVACGGTPVAEPPQAAPELALLEARPTIDGTELPPRADAPRTVVMFFASW